MTWSRAERFTGFVMYEIVFLLVRICAQTSSYHRAHALGADFSVEWAALERKSYVRSQDISFCLWNIFCGRLDSLPGVAWVVEQMLWFTEQVHGTICMTTDASHIFLGRCNCPMISANAPWTSERSLWINNTFNGLIEHIVCSQDRTYISHRSCSPLRIR